MGYVKVKLVDFGIPKIEAQDAYEEPISHNLPKVCFQIKNLNPNPLSQI
jgi:hypothetical protein